MAFVPPRSSTKRHRLARKVLHWEKAEIQAREQEHGLVFSMRVILCLVVNTTQIAAIPKSKSLVK